MLDRVSTHMPLARHDLSTFNGALAYAVSTHMPLARHDYAFAIYLFFTAGFYSHASCEA